MIQENQTDNLFSGKFRLLGLYFKGSRGWKLVKKYEPDFFFWEFIPDTAPDLPPGTVSRSGTLLEYLEGGPGQETGFCWAPEENLLCIDSSYDGPGDGFCEIIVNDVYRVERTDPTDFWLYNLEQVDLEPDDYQCRIRIQKQP